MREEQTNQFRFLGNCPPTPPLRKTLTITSKLRVKCWLRGGVGWQFLRKLNSFEKTTMFVRRLEAFQNPEFKILAERKDQGRLY